ncbi:tRNA1(Val) (adenine(37)-N6)-methyltransferase [Chitinophagaceae bacterium MMS25-I14]
MSNSYFSFKQFSIHQERCAMKVSTDACIQGAWTPVRPHVKNVLDIGCGTGLLSLMLAQRSADIHIDSIELDEDAMKQAQQNVAASPWKDRIEVMLGDARNFPFGKKYDLIICNPPFFNNSLLGGNNARNHARHTVTLSQDDLFDAIHRNLADGGYACILLPAAEKKLWEETVQRNGWHLDNYLLVKDNPDAAVKRIISCCSQEPGDKKEETLTIKDEKGSYTDGFTELLRPFYLKL